MCVLPVKISNFAGTCGNGFLPRDRVYLEPGPVFDFRARRTSGAPGPRKK